MSEIYSTGPDELERWSGEFRRIGVDKFITRGYDLSKAGRIDRHLQILRKITEPYDRLLGQDEELPKGHAFYLSSLLGVALAQEVVGNNQKIHSLYKTFDQIVPIIPTVPSHDEDPAEALHSAGEAVIYTGQRMLEQLPQLKSLLEDDVYGLISTDVTTNLHSGAGGGLGYGLVMYHNYAHIPPEKTHPITIEELVHQGVDVDAALRSFFGYQD